MLYFTEVRGGAGWVRLAIGMELVGRGEESCMHSPGTGEVWFSVWQSSFSSHSHFHAAQLRVASG